MKFRFTRYRLYVVTAIAGVAFGWYAIQEYRLSQQYNRRQAIAAVLSHLVTTPPNGALFPKHWKERGFAGVGITAFDNRSILSDDFMQRHTGGIWHSGIPIEVPLIASSMMTEYAEHDRLELVVELFKGYEEQLAKIDMIFLNSCPFSFSSMQGISGVWIDESCGVTLSIDLLLSAKSTEGRVNFTFIANVP